jgi:hypothetical protein
MLQRVDRAGEAAIAEGRIIGWWEKAFLGRAEIYLAEQFLQEARATTVITRGSTYDNRANLAPAFLQQIVRKYEGTRLGRQELKAEFFYSIKKRKGLRLKIARSTISR